MLTIAELFAHTERIVIIILIIISLVLQYKKRARKSPAELNKPLLEASSNCGEWSPTIRSLERPQEEQIVFFEKDQFGSAQLHFSNDFVIEMPEQEVSKII